MKLEIGDLVLCPPSGSHAGPRLGKVKHLNTNRQGKLVFPVLVGYIDYPEDTCGWFYGHGAWVHPIKKIKFEDDTSET